MKKLIISLFIALAVSAGPLAAEPQDGAQVPKPVIAQVEQDTGGRVLSAVVTEQAYELKVLMPGGRVKIIAVAREK